MRIKGEVWLHTQGHDEVLMGVEDYIQDEAPEHEWPTFLAYAREVLERSVLEHRSAQGEWPEVTDCDRLDQVEAVLRESGILLWQVSPCCDTCTTSELGDRIDAINQRHPGLRDSIRGYGFFIDQNMPEMLSDSSQLSVYLAYGWIPPKGEKPDEETYRGKALGIAKEICGRLQEHGFEADWDGDFAQKIGLSLNWQRRTPLK